MTPPCATRRSMTPPRPARAGGERKRRNLGRAEDGALNFGGQQQELWCEEGAKWPLFCADDWRKSGLRSPGEMVYHAGLPRR